MRSRCRYRQAVIIKTLDKGDAAVRPAMRHETIAIGLSVSGAKGLGVRCVGYVVISPYRQVFSRFCVVLRMKCRRVASRENGIRGGWIRGAWRLGKGGRRRPTETVVQFQLRHGPTARLSPGLADCCTSFGILAAPHDPRRDIVLAREA